MGQSDRSNPLVYLSVGLAALSLCTSLYQSYLFTQQVELMQRNVARGEYMRTCKELIEAYFDVKLKTAAMARSAARAANDSGLEVAAEMSAVNAVSRFAALGTYLANFQNEEIRYRYTTLSRTLEGIADGARKTPPAELDKLFEPADTLFMAMNEDCVRAAKGVAFNSSSSLPIYAGNRMAVIALR